MRFFVLVTEDYQNRDSSYSNGCQRGGLYWGRQFHTEAFSRDSVGENDTPGED